MDNQFRAVPDGQYTQTIYSLVRDQKYQEVRFITIRINFNLIFCRLLIFWLMSCNSVQEIGQHYLSWVTATFTFKTTPYQLRCMINWLSFTQRLTLTNFTMLKVCIRLVCTLKHKKLPNRLKMLSTKKKYCNFKLPFSMNSKKFLTLRHSLDNCQQMLQSLLLHKVACFIKKKNSKRLEQSFKKLLTWLDINAISHTTSHFVTIKWNNLLHLLNILPILLRKESESIQSLVLGLTLKELKLRVLETPKLWKKPLWLKLSI